MAKVACIGECMIELRQAPGGLFLRGFGGDTLNTAVYLARLGFATDYITALGDDTLSDEMIAGWQAEGVGTARVARLKGKLPGIYMIETDARGERKFFHWRENAAARQLMDLPETGAILQSLAGYDIVYLSAITLSIYDEAGRTRLFAALKDIRRRGVRVAFDTNFRARGWPDLETARRVYVQAFEAADIALASTEDLLPLYSGDSSDGLLARIASPEAVLKLAEPASIVRFGGARHEVRAEPLTKPVVDTTAAGDSFAAAYLAARLGGADPLAAAGAGHDLAGVVVCYPGAIIPRSAMPPAGTPKSRKASK
ncbi:sugar kinase [Bradyrhizobium sp.]|uniref:sugar kinase n=1 Tax=Bradyrhizobium sp. TaxID=376 RepID=UPI001DBDF14A|nr:sugar kinase [Bradyrhizobium sp.]MBI5319107.1 sugar kinase [Bradyrhizobium sp.]